MSLMDDLALAIIVAGFFVFASIFTWVSYRKWLIRNSEAMVIAKHQMKITNNHRERTMGIRNRVEDDAIELAEERKKLYTDELNRKIEFPWITKK